MLRHPPTERELARMYQEFAALGAPTAGHRERWTYRPASEEELIALAADMARYDARLLGALVGLVLARWERWNPLTLRRAVQAMREPAAFGVVADFAREAEAPSELRFVLAYVTRGLAPVEPAEHFFIGLVRPGSRMAERVESLSLRSYRRWGFVGSERPVVDPFRKRAVGRPDPSARRHVLARLIERPDGISVGEYLEAIGRSVSRQQALADLHSLGGVRRTGRGRGARWSRIRASRSVTGR